MTERYFFTDSANQTLEYTGDGIEVTGDSFDPSDAETVTLDSPWNDFFGTDEYLTFDATVAQPIVQPYIKNGEFLRLKKSEAELKRAQAQIDNLPWTLDHPPSKKVRTADQIRGFWTDPRWNDGQMATLHVPANDPDAIEYAVENDSVSIGFSCATDWVDDDESSSSRQSASQTDDTDDAEEYDGVQGNFAYDHIASVETARCSPERGCGLHTDSLDEDIDPSEPHGHYIDAVQTQQTEEPDGWDSGDLDEQGSSTSKTSSYDVGDWVKIDFDDDLSHGQIVTVGDDSAQVRVYSHPDGFQDTVSVDIERLREWVGPHVDSCPGDTCSCGCHTTAQTDNQSTTDTDMTNLQELFNDNGITKEQVIDHYDIEQKESPTDFYDSEPDVETLADDFDSVALLMEKNEELEGEVEDLTDSLQDFKRAEFEETAEELTDITDSLGTTDELLEQFDQGEMTVEEINDKLALVEDVHGEETTTVEDETDDANDGGTNITEKYETTPGGKIRVSDPRNA